MRSSWHHRLETRWRGPTTARESYATPRRAPRYVCRDFGHTSILAAPTEAIVRAAVTLRRGQALPNGIDRQRVAIASELLRLDVLPGRPGATTYDPTRLRITFADGTTTAGTPLPPHGIPWEAWPYNRPTANQSHRDDARISWQAIYREAGAVYLGPSRGCSE